MKFKEKIKKSFVEYRLLYYFIFSSIINATMLRCFTVFNYFSLRPFIADLGIIFLFSAWPFLVKEKNKSKEKNIVFTGYVNYDDIDSLYAIADLGIIPSIINEACPLTAIEMMASGIPVICTNSGGLPELINDKCGVIVDRNNLTENLNQAIRKVYNNKNLLDIYAKNAKLRSKKFTKEKYVADFWKYLDEFNKELEKI